MAKSLREFVTNTPATTNPVKPGAGKAAGSLREFVESSGSTPGPAFSSAPMRENPDNYRFNLIPGQDNDLYRAQDQGAWESVGIATANLIPNVLTSIGEQVGQLGSLVTEWGDDRNYSNALTETMKEWKNPAGEIYRENPDQVFDLTDSAWWINNISGLVESIGAFAATGYGVGSLFGKAAQLATRAGVAASRAANAGAHVATAASLAYMEGAMSGYDVYQRTYDTQYTKGLAEGLSPEEADTRAKHLGAQSAASTVQLNTILNTALNMGAVAPLFKKTGTAEAAEFFSSRAGARMSGEALSDWKARISAMGRDSKSLKEFVGKEGALKYLSEAGQEGLEEMVNQFAERTGYDLGEDGKSKGLFEQLGELENFFGRTMDQEGALNFILGAVGGLGQTITLDVVPYHRQTLQDDKGAPVPLVDKEGKVVRDKAGNVQYPTKLYSSRHLADNQRVEYFESVRDAVIKDIDFIEKKHNEIKQARDAGDKAKAEKALNELMSAHQLYAVTTGTAENWITEFEQYASIDNTKDLGAEAKEQADELRNQQEALLKWERVESVDELSEDALAQFEELEQQRQEQLKKSQELDGVTEAMYRGFAENREDTDYQRKAKQTAADLKLYNNWYQSLQKRVAGTEAEELNVPAMVLSRQINNHLNRRLIEELETELALDKAELDKTVTEISGETFNNYVNRYNNRLVKHSRLAQNFQKELERLKNAKSDEEIAAMLSKYRIDFDPDKPGKAIKGLITKLAGLRDKHDSIAEDSEKAITESSEYEAWKSKPENSRKSLYNYLEELGKQVSANNQVALKEIALEQLKEESKIAQEELQNILGNLQKFTQKVRNDLDKVKKDAEARITEENKEISREERETEAAAALSKKQVQYTVRRLDEQRKNLEEELKQLRDELNREPTTTKLGALRKRLTPTARKLKNQIVAKEAQLSLIKEELDSFSGRETMPEREPVLVDIPSSIETSLKDWAETFNGTLSPAILGKQLDALLNSNGIKTSAINKEQKKQLITSLLVTKAEEQQETVDADNSDSIQKLDDLISSVNKNQFILRALIDQAIDADGELVWAPIDNMFVKTGIIDSGTSAKLYAAALAVKEAAVVVQGDTQSENLQEQIETVEPDTKESNPPLPVPDEPDTPIVYPYEKQEDPQQLSSEFQFVGFKTRDVISAARMDLEYKEQFRKGDSKVSKRTTTSKLNPKTNKNVLKPGYIKPGTKIRFEIAEDWEGMVNNDNQFLGESEWEPYKAEDSFSQYTDENGKIADAHNQIGNVPIRVVSENGEVIGWVRRLGWVEARYPGASNYRNVATPEDWADSRLPEGFELPPAINIHVDQLMELRRKIVQFYNSGSEPVTTTVKEIGTGHLIPNLNERGEQIEGRAELLLPDKNLTLVNINSQGIAEVGKGVNFEGQLTVDEDVLVTIPNTLHAAAPMTGGQYALIPLRNPKLQQFEVDTMLHAIEIYLSDNKQAAKRYNELTGFDVLTAEGLRNFINQHYTYTQSFKKEDLVPSSDLEAVPKFVFNISNEVKGKRKALISTGWTYTGQPRMDAVLRDGKLSPEFREAFEEGMKSRFKNIVTDQRLRSINSAGSINEVVFDGSELIIRKAHDSYNDYVKSFSYTRYNGTNQAEDGTYIYGVHPNITFDMKGVRMSRPTRSEERTMTPADIVEEGPTPENINSDSFTQEDADDLSDIEAFSRDSGGREKVSIELLQNLQRELPENQRNGKTTEDIMEELREAGIKYLPENFNPFRKC